MKGTNKESKPVSGSFAPPGPLINIGAGAISPPDLHWIIGKATSNIGDLPQVSTKLLRADRLGSFKVRWGIGRHDYRVPPGLYAVGRPDDKSPVMVSANYKMSFDRLRSNLEDLDCWIMVLDTRGINVWCAAGKGTFGTEEIIRRIELTQLGKVVGHRRLIVPQLGAPGVAAHAVKERSGFRVIYGPIRAEDIKQFISDGYKATPAMRRVRFDFMDRAVLIPCDMVLSLKYFVPIAMTMFILSGLGRDVFSFDRMLHYGLFNLIILASAYFTGHILPPVLLPYLPGRAFAAKGAIAGFLVGIVFYIMYILSIIPLPGDLTGLAWIMIIISMTSFIALNFTGNSTYTSLSGVKREMKLAVPLQVTGAVIGSGLWIAGIYV